MAIIINMFYIQEKKNQTTKVPYKIYNTNFLYFPKDSFWKVMKI